jgi:glucose/arabinose dehydrogenase
MRLIGLAVTVSAIALAAACSAQDSVPSGPGAPVESRPANAPDQQPAFAGQTRAAGVHTNLALSHAVVASGLEHPWGLALMPDGRWLVTERPGRLRIISVDGDVSAPVAGLPPVAARGQGGLLDVVTGFATDRMIYWSYAEPREGGNATAVARGRLSDDGARVEAVQVIFHALPTYDGDKHFGSSLAFDSQGHLFVTLGERSDAPMRPQAQDPGSHMGKTIRIHADGSVPADNPYVGQAGALPEIWSLGHRNMQGVAIQPGTGAVWTIEHGARGGDEVNLDRAGANYGWPDAAYGIEYRGGPINAGLTTGEGTEQPVYYWDPVIAPGGATFYDGAMFPGWRGNLLVASLKEKHIARLVIRDDRVVGEERLLSDLGERVRDVAVGPDGAIWAITDEADGKLVRLAVRP